MFHLRVNQGIKHALLLGYCFSKSMQQFLAVRHTMLYLINNNKHSKVTQREMWFSKFVCLEGFFKGVFDTREVGRMHEWEGIKHRYESNNEVRRREMSVKASQERKKTPLINQHEWRHLLRVYNERRLEYFSLFWCWSVWPQHKTWPHGVTGALHIPPLPQSASSLREHHILKKKTNKKKTWLHYRCSHSQQTIRRTRSHLVVAVGFSVFGAYVHLRPFRGRVRCDSCIKPGVEAESYGPVLINGSPGNSVRWVRGAEAGGKAGHGGPTWMLSRRWEELNDGITTLNMKQLHRRALYRKGLILASL